MKLRPSNGSFCPSLNITKKKHVNQNFSHTKICTIYPSIYQTIDHFRSFASCPLVYDTPPVPIIPPVLAGSYLSPFFVVWSFFHWWSFSMHSYGVYERAVGSGKHTDDQVTQMGIFWGNLCVFPDRMFFFICAIPPPVEGKERGSGIFWNRARSDRIGSDQIKSRWFGRVSRRY